MKQAKVKGGVYSGCYWYEFHTSQEAKKMAHKQARQAWKKYLK